MTPAKKGVLRRCSLSQRAEMQKEKVQGRESSPMRNQETLRRKLNEAGATEQGRGSYFNAGPPGKDGHFQQKIKVAAFKHGAETWDEPVLTRCVDGERRQGKSHKST
ncbi:hypothetical protein MGG_16467 [Pyricularia oryzae 70-15]|uniref:Uncharacterized protein n=3 Tax=Pyricularia oryzae TaxID=318829 RepID=G4MPY1_PYRO7|nr:uncharacterized protein MGG_16467 [Pyricularia oryzae 70-15]EHA58069.1 hypothetical protein MGG_16467 [Pyricularia oryzae 70-15]